MKKLLVIPLIILSTSLFAQKFQIGLKGGVNISNFNGLNAENVENKAILGFHGGAFLNLLFGDHFSLSPEALFSSQGSRLKYAGNENDFKVSYLAVPVMLRYRFNGGFYLEAGPQVSFKINEDFPENATVRNFAKSLDMAFDAGLGYHSNMGLGIGARYVVGISDVGDFDANEINPDFKNSVAQIFIFYTLFNNRK